MCIVPPSSSNQLEKWENLTAALGKVGIPRPGIFFPDFRRVMNGFPLNLSHALSPLVFLPIRPRGRGPPASNGMQWEEERGDDDTLR